MNKGLVEVENGVGNAIAEPLSDGRHNNNDIAPIVKRTIRAAKAVNN